ncbi:MAG: hypothetical protein M1816_001560 [Peltula sp. TS41687]|nr:MAG: hypothetical protein M1816_001560 [Peltula sp. TS41687]
MSTQSAPVIPPRLARINKEQRPARASNDIPRIPPRPARRSDRSISPQRQDSFAPSPLNEPNFAVNHRSLDGIAQKYVFDASASAVPQRPPSVTLPSIGQEGNEYAGFYEKPVDTSNQSQAGATSSPATRNVGVDLELHAPKPALPTSSAKARIATVTRTDSSQAAAVGIGKTHHDDDKDPHLRPLKAKASFASQHSLASAERASSTQPGDSEHGIPEIGQRVPMYPHAGDVQAPSPSPFMHNSPFGGGAGAYNEGQHRSSRHHLRTRSSREHFHGPPGSYGLHGHGTPAHDKFEKAWYDKHPEALEREEHGEYGPGIGGGRGAWALSREELDRLVRETAAKGVGVGTSPAVLGTPNEEIGYLASEEYAAKLASSRPSSNLHHHQTESNASQGHVQSPLKKAIFTEESLDNDEKIPKEGLDPTPTEPDRAVESEDDENVIHVVPPLHRFDKIGGGGYDPPTEDLGPHGGNTAEEGGWIDERGYGVPILASDEIAKDPGAEFLHPAVSPPLERIGNEYHSAWEPDHNSHQERASRTVSQGSSASVSRANSRTRSISGGLGPGLSRYLSADDREEISTKLEDVEEYEPLFPEDEHNKESGPQFLGKSRREVLLQHKFPSQDIWEDAPESTQLQAIVSMPALPEEDARTVVPDNDDDRSSVVGIAPLQERTDDVEQLKPGDFGERGQVNGQTKAEKEDTFRPGMKQRFPSRDIWEDTPASLQLQTVVMAPQIEEVTSPPEQPEKSAQEEGITAPALKGEEGANNSITGETSDKPTVPARPARTGQLSKGFTGQPAVPARPSSPSKRMQRSIPSNVVSNSTEEAGLSEPQKLQQGATVPESGGSKEEGKGSQPSSPVTERKAPGLPERPKPPVPARPAKPAREDTGEGGVSLSKTASASGVSEEGRLPPAPARSKPTIPARPNGSKIAALKAGFMNDLDKRLQMGPQAPKGPPKVVMEETDTPEKDRAPPLSDARKGRARGPARRKPAASPSDATNETTAEKTTGPLEMTKVFMAWQISSDDGSLNVVTGGSTKSTTKDKAAESTSSSDPTKDETSRKDLTTSGDDAEPKSSGDAAQDEQLPKSLDRDRDSTPGEGQHTVEEDASSAKNNKVGEDNPIRPSTSGNEAESSTQDE